jgi:hypothetical protein
MMLSQFLSYRTQVIAEVFETHVCGKEIVSPSVLAALAAAPGSDGWSDSLLVVEPTCGPLPRPTGAYRTIVRLDSIVIGRESSYVQARSLRGWVGRGPRPFREWLTERLVWHHVQIPGQHSFTVSGWSGVRDSPR